MFFFKKVRTNTHGVGFIDLVSVVAGAHETAKGVGAATIFAQVVHFRTLVNVFQNDLERQYKISSSNNMAIKENSAGYFQFTVIMLGLNPDPAGHKAFNSSESGAGQISHCGPQALPTEQQQVDRETMSSTLFVQTLRPAGVCWTSRKQDPTRLSVIVNVSINCIRNLWPNN